MNYSSKTVHLHLVLVFDFQLIKSVIIVKYLSYPSHIDFVQDQYFTL